MQIDHTTDIVNENSQPVVVLELYDKLIKSEQSILLSNLLKTKLSEKQLVSFSESFTLQDTIKIEGIGGGGTNAPDPLDIVLSYKHSLIIVSLVNISSAPPPEARERVLAFDLKSRKYIGCLLTPTVSVQCVLVEENYDGKGNEALYVSLNKSSIEKFDLKSLINAMKVDHNVQPPEPLWKTDFEDEFYGMCIDYNRNYEERCLYACGTNNICQFKTVNGKLINKSFFTCREPWGIRMNNRGQFIYSIYPDGKVQVMERNNVGTSGSGDSGDSGGGGWKNTMTISGDTYAGGLCIDETNQNIIVCSDSSIAIYSSSDGREIVTRQDEEAQNGKGCFLDSKTGELYVAACGSGMITIWK